MAPDVLFFSFFSLLALVGGVLTVTRRSAVHSAISLIVSLIGVAGLFLLQRAEFLFAVQIVLYIGGIMVLFLFVIMLVNLDEAAKLRQFNRQWWIAGACVLALGAEALYFLRQGAGSLRLAVRSSGAGPDGNTERVADTLFTGYLVPFEVASVLLLVAIVGSVFLARKRT